MWNLNGLDIKVTNLDTNLYYKFGDLKKEFWDLKYHLSTMLKYK